MCFTGFLSPQYQDKEFVIFQPAFFGELALMLWLLIKGAKPPALDRFARSEPTLMWSVERVFLRASRLFRRTPGKKLMQ
jgi:hypothetical protein